MLSRNQIKYINDLSRKTIRYQERKFVVEGEKLVNELLGSNFSIDEIYALESWGGVSDFTIVSEKDLTRISQLKTANKVVAVVNFPEEVDLRIEDGLTLFLDRINDPGNLGTIIRMADWFGVKAIICSKNSVDHFNSKVIQSSMGSIFRLPVFYVDSVEFLTQVKEAEIPIYGAAMEGELLGAEKLPSNAVLVMGSESHGIDKAIEPLLTQKITIPKFGAAESLNVGVATGILLWEWKRG